VKHKSHGEVKTLTELSMLENFKRMIKIMGNVNWYCKCDSVQSNGNDGKQFYGLGVEQVGSTNLLTVCVTM
jgi:hypothetical protein